MRKIEIFNEEKNLLTYSKGSENREGELAY